MAVVRVRSRHGIAVVGGGRDERCAVLLYGHVGTPGKGASGQARGTAVISVVMPVHNAAPTLSAAVESLLRQTEPAWELVAIDDGSTDASGAILEAYARRHRRIRVIRAERRGLVVALNAGLAAATGWLIARFDADDICLPERLAHQRRRFDSRPDVGLVASRVRFGGDPALAAGYARHVSWTNRLLSHDDISLARFVESPLAHPSVMFRRALVEHWGGYEDGDFPEDYELWLRWLESGVRMEKLAETLLVWNDSPTRLSRSDSRYAKEAFYRLKARYLARWLAVHNPHHPAVIVWGAGRITRKRVQHLVEQGITVDAFIDIDPHKIGRRIGGRPVLAPGELPAHGTSFVVSYVGGSDAREQIESSLRASGYRCGADELNRRSLTDGPARAPSHRRAQHHHGLIAPSSRPDVTRLDYSPAWSHRCGMSAPSTAPVLRLMPPPGECTVVLDNHRRCRASTAWIFRTG